MVKGGSGQSEGLPGELLQVRDDGGAHQSGIGGEGDEKCSDPGRILNVERTEFPNGGPKRPWEFELTPLEGRRVRERCHGVEEVGVEGQECSSGCAGFRCCSISKWRW